MLRPVASLALALALASCSHVAPPEREPTLDDFQGFQAWTRTPVPTTDVYAHAIYSSPLADQGPPWQLGAAFVRAEESGPPSAWLLHGMIRRGGDFNAGLASGWEFFGLFVDEHGATRLIWRGEHPPLSAGYVEPDTGETDDGGGSGLPAGDCNVCHHDPDAIIPYR